MSSFFVCMAKVIYTDPFVCKYYWTVKDMNTLLYSIKVYIEVVKLAYNCCKKSLNLINREWDMDVKKYIWFRGLVE